MTGPLAQILDSWNYLVVIVLMMGGLFIVISQTNLVKKLVGLAIFQTSVFLFYISAGKIAGGTRRPGRAGKQHKDTEPGGEHDDRLAEGVEPAVAGQHGGHDIRDVEEGPAFLEITRRDMNMRRRQRVADRRQFDGGQDQQRAGKATDHKCRKDVPQPLRLRRRLLGAREIGHRGEEQHRRDPGPDSRLGKGDVDRVEIDEHRLSLIHI